MLPGWRLLVVWSGAHRTASPRRTAACSTITPAVQNLASCRCNWSGHGDVPREHVLPE
jgi:hypothetical protein